VQCLAPSASTCCLIHTSTVWRCIWRRWFCYGASLAVRINRSSFVCCMSLCVAEALDSGIKRLNRFCFCPGLASPKLCHFELQILNSIDQDLDVPIFLIASCCTPRTTCFVVVSGDGRPIILSQWKSIRIAASMIGKSRELRARLIHERGRDCCVRWEDG
jgi:hypothetical protein